MPPRFLAEGTKELTDVLQSAAVWTGKDGVKSVGDLLSNSSLQDKIQQGLMKTGLDAVKQVGIPVDKLSAPALAGVATLAAKSPAGAVAALTGGGGGLPSLPGLPSVPSIPSSVPALGNLADKAQEVVSNSAFAVKVEEEKVEPPVKQEEPVVPATNTVDSATLDAAGARVVGNDKVPTVAANGATAAARTTIAAYSIFITEQYAGVDSLEKKVLDLQTSWTTFRISQDQYDALNGEYQALKATWTARAKDLQTAMVTAVNEIPEGDDRAKFVAAGQSTQRLATLFIEAVKRINAGLKDLRTKIST